MAATFSLPPLPWPADSLASKGMSAEQIDFHYNKHHKGYVTKLNAAAEKRPELRGKSVMDLIQAKDATYNLASQIWNHTFFWNCLSPNGGGAPTGAAKQAIERDFGSFDKMKKQFSDAAGGHFGSGWAWLVQDKNNRLKVHQTHDAGNPIPDGLKPVLTCDVWEHAFYIDYRNDKAKYVNSFWNMVNWDFVNAQLANSRL
ncbi:Superoxide dismutase [Diplonema papillatum]|nr:Superoxide dismutase [Diplonema papillatum]|eukprot:gene14129-21650_t